MNSELWATLDKASQSKVPTDFAAAEKAVLAAKSRFITYSCFNGEATNTPLEQVSQELAVVRDVLEAAVLLSISRECAEDFERNFMELENVCLSEVAQKNLGISERQPFIFAVAMLWHLSKNNLEQFHLLVRRCIGVKQGLPANECWTFFGVPVTSLSAKNQEYLNFPLNLEREIMDGNIAAVLAAANEKLPDLRFNWCVQGLVATLRQRVATSLKCAYKQMPFEHACRLLAFKNPADLLAFIEADQQKVLASAANADKESDPLFAVRWSRADSQSGEVQERPSTPSALPKAGEGKLFSALARTSSTGSTGTKAFTLGQAKAGGDAVEPKVEDQNKQSRGMNLDGAFLKNEVVRGSNVQWHLKETPSGSKDILFKETTPKKPLVPAGELMQQWIGYVIDLEMVV
eukprot:Blabericola_migrator_1__10081@NODE_55_length_16001_cov_154_094327_g51_i0_p7_GENE_NODE_55_length_16001_cov_154_094327_g51_i0NODE_55_length_16001_cov_154_094327_g51_i0_p7_ORF_typecomplete_len404_score88_65CSN8_PSD8_EIF3K/PF10075_9/5_1e16SAC3_GANP/PF03399_16/0_00035HPS6/PF15702_5/0_11_NODE_55_length_16001_cov_154_094327_g51_i019773188